MIGIAAAFYLLMVALSVAALQGCDASVMLMASNGDDESHSGADATLSPDAVEAVNKAKAAVEALPGCAGKVSCADILAMAARDVVSLVRML